MDKDIFDDKLKSMAKNEKNDIPESLRKKANETYDLIYKDKGQTTKKAKYKYLKVASVLIAALLGVNIVMPTFAESIPIIGEVFKVLNENLGVTTEYSKYGVEINKSMKIDEDETLTIKSVAYDGIEVAVFYEVSSPKALKDDNYYLNLKFNGRNIGGYGGSCFGKKRGENIFYGIASYQIEFDGNLLNPPKKIKLDFEISSVYNLEGEPIYFYVDNTVKVKLDSTKYPSIEKNLNKTIETKVADITIQDVYLTGLNLALTTTTKIKDDHSDVGFYMIDNESGPLIDDGGLGDTKENVKKSILYSKVAEKKIGKVTFIPYINNIWDMKIDEENNSIKEEININKGGVLDYKEKGFIEFNPIEFRGDNGYLNIRTKGLFMFEYISLVSIDKNGEEQYHWGVVRDESYNNGEYSYTLEFNGMSESTEYKYVKYYGFDNLDILEEDIFEVDFSK